MRVGVQTDQRALVALDEPEQAPALAAAESTAEAEAAIAGATDRLALVRASVTTAATLAHERTLPVRDGLANVVPGGVLQRGSTLAVHGNGATTFGLALLSEAAQRGSFLAIVAPSSFNLAACADAGVPLRRVVQFDLGERTARPQMIAAILDGFDLVLLADRHRFSARDARQLVARNRERGSVLVRCQQPPWAEAADLRFDLADPAWSGLGQGSGHLQSRQIVVQASGRRHGASRRHQVWLPAVDGEIESVVSPHTASITPIGQASEDRFAGADIDDLLDVIDGPPNSFADDDDASAGLGAIA